MGSRLSLSGPHDSGLERGARIAGVAVLVLLVGIAIGAGCGCKPPSPSCPVRTDDLETPAELAAGDACHRAGVRLQKLGCKEWRPDWDAFCHHMLDEGVPLCPTKISRATTCAAVNEVCR